MRMRSWRSPFQPQQPQISPLKIRGRAVVEKVPTQEKILEAADLEQITKFESKIRGRHKLEAALNNSTTHGEASLAKAEAVVQGNICPRASERSLKE